MIPSSRLTKFVIHTIVAVFIVILGFTVRNVAFNLGVVNCKGLTAVPLFAVNSLILFVLAYFVRSKELGTLAQIAYTMVFAAGIGNLLDELLNKCVLDYFSIFGVYFNMFDIFICTGLLILGFTYTTKKVK